jgi:hypothetical protein
MLINRVTSENVCRLTPLVHTSVFPARRCRETSSFCIVFQIVSDLTDEDSYVHKRREPLSASIAGAAAFVPKFSQSLAPMLG